MRKQVKGVIAILLSDVHLSHKAPIARSAEPDWYYAMARPLLQVERLKELYEVPVVCAGDIFDHWKSPPELVNFAIRMLPKGMYAVPGQHDLAYHSLEDIRKSAYWTLVAAGIIEDLPHGVPIKVNDILHLWGVPWNCDIPDTDGFAEEGEIHLAVIHAYNWMKGKSYPGAPEKGNCLRWKKKLDKAGFTASVFGDNHKGFTFGSSMLNCGGFMRRKIDEIKYQSQVGLLTKWGKIVPVELDVSEDKFIDAESTLALAEKGLEMGSFLAELATLGDTSLNFIEQVTRYCVDNGIDKSIKRIILEALEKRND